MPRNRLANLDDLGQDLLALLLENLPMQSRGQLEAVCKAWRNVSVEAGWRHISYRSSTRAHFLPFVDWLRISVLQRRPEAVESIRLRAEGIGEDLLFIYHIEPFTTVSIRDGKLETHLVNILMSR